MADLLWHKMPKEQKDEYRKFLKIFGALSGLFKDATEGKNAKKPYLYYRNHEQLYARCFDVEDLTRSDSSYDVVYRDDEGAYGVGLKTWFHSKDITDQKIAEFGKMKDIIVPLYDSPDELAKKVSELRNERILRDKRLHETDTDVYHIITRDDGVMNIVECTYDLVDVDNIQNAKKKKSSISFTDGKNNYSFLPSKNTLFKEFNASEQEVVEKLPITFVKDPFALLEHISIEDGEKLLIDNHVAPVVTKEPRDFIVLPLYSDERDGPVVYEKSSFNASLAKSKQKGSNVPRPAYEAYLGIPKYIHKLKPNFFGFNALNDDERNGREGFTLDLPSGKSITARVTQEYGKALQTNPQSILGKWILHDIFGLSEYEMLTLERLKEVAVDSVIITRLAENHFKIDIAPYLGYESWKVENQEAIQKLMEDREIQGVVFRPELLEE